MTWGGEFENQRRTMRRLMVDRAHLRAGDPLLLYMSFRAALPALVVLLDVPFATVGGVFGLLPHPHGALGVGGGRLSSPSSAWR